MNKYIKDGKVGVILSTTPNQQWYTANFDYTQEHEELLFCPPLVEVLMKETYSNQDVIQALESFGCEFNSDYEFFNYKHISELYLPEFDLYWIPQGKQFQIVFDYADDLDASNELLTEILIVFDPQTWLTA